jgi:Fe-S-cluster containining protein
MFEKGEKGVSSGLLTDLVQIRMLARSKEPENLAFRRYLRNHHYSDEAFRRVAADVEAQVDCMACANCCRQTVVNVSAEEVAEIARYLGIDEEQVAHLYLTADPEVHGGRILINEPDGCIFLDGNLCTIYDARPQACRAFPHLTRHRSLATRMDAVCRRAWMCPIVFNALEEYKHLVGFHWPVH